MAAIDEASGSIVGSESRRYSEVAKGYSSFREGDVLFAKITPCMQNGKAAIARNLRASIGFGSTEFHVLRPRPGLLPEWVFAFIRQPSLRSAAMASFTGSAGQQRVPAEFLRKSLIPVPPLSEQERLVKLLDEADELRKLRAQADRRTAELVPALFYEMFGDPEYPRFPVKRLFELISQERPITYGILKPGADTKGGIPYVRVTDIKQNRLRVQQLMRTSKEIGYQYRRSMLCPGDILITIRGTVGRTCIVPEELKGANITQDTARLAIVPSVEANYAIEFLNTHWAQSWMKHHTLGQAVKGINLGDLRKLLVPIPPLTLQASFADRVSEIRELEAEQTASRLRLEALFQSLLHRAFMGED